MDIEEFSDTELIDEFGVVVREMMSRMLFDEALKDMFNLIAVQCVHSDEVI